MSGLLLENFWIIFMKVVLQTKKKSIIKEIAVYSGSRYISEALLSIRGLIIAKFLGPSLYGVWCIIKIFLSIGELIDFGVNNSMVREASLEYGRNRPDRSLLIQNISFCWGCLTSISFAIFAFALTFTSVIQQYNYEWRLACIGFVATAIYSNLRIRLQSENKITAISKLNLLTALVNTVLGLILLFLFNVSGLLLGIIFTYSFIFYLMKAKKYFLISLCFDRQLLFGLLKLGLPLKLITLSVFLMYRMDNVIVFSLLGKKLAGYYGLATFLTIIITYIPQSISVVLFPKIMRQFGKTNNKKELEFFLAGPIFYLSLIMPVIIGCIFIAIDVPIIYFLEKYTPAIPCLRVLIIALYFSAFITIPTNIVIALKQHMRLLKWNCAVVILGGILDCIAIKKGYGIVGVAYTTGIMFLLMSFAAYSTALWSIGKPLAKIIISLLNLFLPFAYGIGSLSIAWHFGFSANNLLRTAIIRIIYYLILSVPLFYFFHKYRNRTMRSQL